MFTLGSPSITELMGNEPEKPNMTTIRSESLSSDSFFTSGAASQTFAGSSSFTSTPSHSNISESSGSCSGSSRQARHLSDDSKINRPFVPPVELDQIPSPDSRATTYSKVRAQRNLFMKKRQDLLEKTLRQMQIASQENNEQNQKKEGEE